MAAWMAEQDRRMSAAAAERAELRRAIGRVWIKPVAAVLAAAIPALIGGWFSWQSAKAQLPAQAAETARQTVAGPETERIAEKAARLALEANDRERERRIEATFNRLLAQVPMNRPPKAP